MARQQKQTTITTPLPHDLEAEEAALGSVLIDPTTLDQVKAHLAGTDDFYLVKNAWVFSAMLVLQGQGQPIDFLTMRGELERRGQLAEIGGLAFLSHLTNTVPTAIHAEGYARIVAAKARDRRIIDLASQIAKAGYDGTPHALADLVAKLQTVHANGNGHNNGTTWADIKTTIAPITWAWRPWLPNGLLTIIAGESGAGKSALALRVAGCYLAGWPWPDGARFAENLGAVVWCEAEAAQAVNLERAEAWGLPTQNLIDPLGGLDDIRLDDPTHRAAIVAAARRGNVRLVVLDSLSGATSRNEDKSNEALPTVKFLAELARDTGKPVLLTHHLRKRGILDVTDRVTLERIRGSSAIIQTSRVVWALDVPDQNKDREKRLSMIKNNLARFPDPIGVTIDAHGVMFGTAPEPPKRETLQDKAIDMLMAILSGGPMAVDEIEEHADGLGLSMPTVRKAKEKIGIVHHKDGKTWLWGLPAKNIN